MVSEGAPGQEMKNGVRERAGDSLARGNLAGDSCRCRGGRRTIRAAWRHNLRRKREGRGRSARSFIAFEGGAFNREITVSNHRRYLPERKEEGIAGGRRCQC
jgi:hypothetical protein